MISLIIKKLLLLFATILCVITLTFFMMKAVPGDPFNEEKALSKEVHESLKEHYGLNAPLSEQYLKYLTSIASLDLGPSIKYKGRTVNQMIKEGFPISLTLGLEALCLAIGLGVSLGALSVIFDGGFVKKLIIGFIIIGISLPNFACATFLQYLLAIQYNIFPVARWGSFAHTFLPAISLALLPAAFIAKLIRGQMQEVMSKEFIKICVAKGLTNREIFFHHSLKNSLLPLLAYLGQLAANILVGSFIIEKIFSIPGLGGWFVKSVMSRDYSVIMGLTVFYSILLGTTVLIFDLLALSLDPRLRPDKIKKKRAWIA